MLVYVQMTYTHKLYIAMLIELIKLFVLKYYCLILLAIVLQSLAKANQLQK